MKINEFLGINTVRTIISRNFIQSYNLLRRLAKVSNLISFKRLRFAQIVFTNFFLFLKLDEIEHQKTMRMKIVRQGLIANNVRDYL